MSDHRPDPTKDVQRCAMVLGAIATRASAQVWRMGTDWYPCAFDMARTVAERNGVQPVTVCGMLAALSPMVSWVQQCTSIDAFVGAELTAHGTGKHAGFPTNLRKARRILHDACDPLDVLSGVKVRTFYRALTGDVEAVTVDRHAIAAACSWSHTVPAVTDKRTERVATAHRIALMRLGRPWLKPRELQAVVWSQWRLEKRGTLVRNGAPGTHDDGRKL